MVVTFANNSDGMLVNRVQFENVSRNYSFAPVVMLSNNPSGIAVNDVQPWNVLWNKLGALVVIFSNKPAGIAINDEQLVNVCRNIYGAPPVIPENRLAGIVVKFEHPLNDVRNIGCCPLFDPNVGNNAPNDPITDATDLLSWKLIAAAASLVAVLYPVATPLNAIICVPAVGYVHVYVAWVVFVLVIVVPDTSSAELVNTPSSPQETSNVPTADILNENVPFAAIFVVLIANLELNHCAVNVLSDSYSHVNVFPECLTSFVPDTAHPVNVYPVFAHVPWFAGVND